MHVQSCKGLWNFTDLLQFKNLAEKVNYTIPHYTKDIFNKSLIQISVKVNEERGTWQREFMS